MRVGVFGGEFDPPHTGHLAVVRAAREQLALDRVIVVPTARPPHREASPTPAETRLRLAEAAFAEDPAVEVSRMELDREGPSYTVDTLRALKPRGDLVLILGADQASDLLGGRWHESQEVLRLAHLAVAPRGEMQGLGRPDVTVLRMDPVDVSSTGVRAALRAGRGSDQVPGPVLALIRTEGLYRQTPVLP
jgi:nicotinate-nucleotide adenylyltransferase